tara:strand:+ start:78 stop:1124 length:1047 start_codon:yes stop_codon:yes gene_type:complete
MDLQTQQKIYLDKMNRVLKRPMFRMGGSSGTGITSGLDKPRQGYKIPGLVNVLPTQEEFAAAKEMYPQFKSEPSQALNRLLISGGLDLLSRPPQGGTLATAAAAFKEPTKQLFEDIDTERATKFATDADLFGTLIKAKGEALSGGASRGQTLQIADDIEKTMDIIFGLEKKENLSDADQSLLSTKKERLRKLTKSDDVQSSLLRSDEYTNKIRRKIRDNLIDQKNPDGSLKYPKGTDDLNLLEDITKFYLEFFKTGEFPTEIRTSQAEGGRIGYQMGGGADIISTKEEPKIDFSTLRARLPKEISDDVVRLISASPEALEDFATIATQSDVDMFNQKYSVNLTLPQEA